MAGIVTDKYEGLHADADLRNSELELDRAIESLKDVAGMGRPPSASSQKPTSPSNNAAMMNIPVEVHAVFGAARMSLAELSELGPGATILLDRSAGDPIDIMANGVRIATGEMVVLDDEQEGRFGFRLLEVLK